MKINKKTFFILQIVLILVSAILTGGLLVSKPVQEVPAMFIQACLCVVVILFTALYCFVLYKQPHGNILKYAMLLAATVNIINCALAIKYEANVYFGILTLLCSLAIGYTSGRLNRSKEVITILSISAIIFAADAIYYLVAGNSLQIVVAIDYVCIILTLILAYTMRYYAHKGAGMFD